MLKSVPRTAIEAVGRLIRYGLGRFPSQTDTFGLVLLEAMAAGIPVIVNAETGVRDEMSVSVRRFRVLSIWPRVFEQVYETYDAGLECGLFVPNLRVSEA
jgi:glycosyltransferase involved in cell wall biosynthesis